MTSTQTPARRSGVAFGLIALILTAIPVAFMALAGILFVIELSPTAGPGHHWYSLAAFELGLWTGGGVILLSGPFAVAGMIKNARRGATFAVIALLACLTMMAAAFLWFR